MRDGEEFNKEKGGEVFSLDEEGKIITVSGLFGESLYSYNILDENKISIKAGKRAGVVEGLIDVANMIAVVPQNKDQYLVRQKRFDCDGAPKDLGDFFNQMSDQLKKGNYKRDGNTIIIEDPNEEKAKHPN